MKGSGQMIETLNKSEVTDEELEKLVFIYKNLTDAERSQIIYGANLLYASSKARKNENSE